METAIDLNEAGKTESSAAAIKKKLNKKKNKSKNRGTNSDKCTTEIQQTTQSLNNDEIRDVSEELLKRLQLNGTSVSRATNGQNAIDGSCDVIAVNEPDQKSSKRVNNGANHAEGADKRKQQHQKQTQLHNNNNNRKVHNKNNNPCKQKEIVNSRNEVETSSSHESTGKSRVAQCNGNHSNENGDVSEINTKIDHVTETTFNPAQVEKSKVNSLIRVAEETELTAKAPLATADVVETNAENDYNLDKCCEHSLEQPSTSPVSEVETSSSSLCSAASVASIKTPTVEVTFKEYENELQMPDIMRVIQNELSEPYSIYTYRYFIHNWPKLCFLAMDGDKCIGAIVCKLDIHRQMTKRGYIAMLAVDAAYRKLKVGTTLVRKAIEAMLAHQADEVVLETEITNTPALRLYENLGFVRDKRLFDYYLNGVDALRLKLWFK